MGNGEGAVAHPVFLLIPPSRAMTLTIVMAGHDEEDPGLLVYLRALMEE